MNHETQRRFSWGPYIFCLAVALVITIVIVATNRSSDQYYVSFDNGTITHLYQAKTISYTGGVRTLDIRKCEVGPQMEYTWTELSEEVFPSDDPNKVSDPGHKAPFSFTVRYNREHVPFLKTITVPAPNNPKQGVVLDPQVLEAELIPGVYLFEQGKQQMLVRVSSADDSRTGYRYEYVLLS